MARTLTRRHAAAALAASTLALHQRALWAQSGLERFDHDFIEDTAQNAVAEIELGRLAAQRASAVQVQTFADTVVQEHGKLNHELSTLARAKGVDMPAAPDRGQQRDAQRLGKLSGADFDRAYMKHMTAFHKRSVTRFERAAQAAKDPELRAFVTRNLPTLETHLAAAQNVESTIAGK